MCALLVVIVFGFGILSHGVGEGASEHSRPSSVLALTTPAADMHNSASDALCSHVHSEHHQLAPCIIQQNVVQRAASRAIYAAFHARAISYEAAPPHGPPKA